MKIFGIDPGSVVLGWAVLQLDDKNQLRQCSHGVLRSPQKGTFHERLGELANQLRDLLLEEQPQVVSVEKIFLGKNADSAFKLGHIRGACFVESLRVGAEVVEFTPREVKKMITGNGAADKVSLRRVLYQELGLSPDLKLPLDASDALALAYGYYLKRRVEHLWQSRTANQ